ncbi:MAG: hypothetical protein ACRD2E_08985 [Terriglobales bacterium]
MTAAPTLAAPTPNSTNKPSGEPVLGIACAPWVEAAGWALGLGGVVGDA